MVGQLLELLAQSRSRCGRAGNCRWLWRGRGIHAFHVDCGRGCGEGYPDAACRRRPLGRWIVYRIGCRGRAWPALGGAFAGVRGDQPGASGRVAAAAGQPVPTFLGKRFSAGGRRAHVTRRALGDGGIHRVRGSCANGRGVEGRECSRRARTRGTLCGRRSHAGCPRSVWAGGG